MLTPKLADIGYKEDFMIRNDNRGISLVELLAVISILAILATGGISLYRQLGYADTKRAANRVNTAMDEVRMETMSRAHKSYLYLYQINGIYYLKRSIETNSAAADLDAESGTELSNKISLSYRYAATPEVTLQPGMVLKISFDRSSGMFDQELELIQINSANHTTEITCVPETGRHWVE